MLKLNQGRDRIECSIPNDARLQKFIAVESRLMSDGT